MSEAVAAANLLTDLTQLLSREEYRALSNGVIRAVLTDAMRRRGTKRQTKPTPGELPGFTAFWDAYPAHRRVDRAGCARKWAAKGLEGLSEAILSAVHTQTASEQWTKERGTFVPMTSTYLNQRRWEGVAEDRADLFRGAL